MPTLEEAIKAAANGVDAADLVVDHAAPEPQTLAARLAELAQLVAAADQLAANAKSTADAAAATAAAKADTGHRHDAATVDVAAEETLAERLVALAVAVDEVGAGVVGVSRGLVAPASAGGRLAALATHQGDGVADEAAIAAALATYDEVHLAPGTYVLAADLQLGADQALAGAGPATRLQLAEGVRIRTADRSVFRGATLAHAGGPGEGGVGLDGTAGVLADCVLEASLATQITVTGARNVVTADVRQADGHDPVVADDGTATVDVRRNLAEVDARAAAALARTARRPLWRGRQLTWPDATFVGTPAWTAQDGLDTQSGVHVTGSGPTTAAPLVLGAVAARDPGMSGAATLIHAHAGDWHARAVAYGDRLELAVDAGGALTNAAAPWWPSDAAVLIELAIGADGVGLWVDGVEAARVDDAVTATGIAWAIGGDDGGGASWARELPRAHVGTEVGQAPPVEAWTLTDAELAAVVPVRGWVYRETA